MKVVYNENKEKFYEKKISLWFKYAYLALFISIFCTLYIILAYINDWPLKEFFSYQAQTKSGDYSPTPIWLIIESVLVTWFGTTYYRYGVYKRKLRLLRGEEIEVTRPNKTNNQNIGEIFSSFGKKQLKLVAPKTFVVWGLIMLASVFTIPFADKANVVFLFLPWLVIGFGVWLLMNRGLIPTWSGISNSMFNYGSRNNDAREILKVIDKPEKLNSSLKEVNPVYSVLFGSVLVTVGLIMLYFVFRHDQYLG